MKSLALFDQQLTLLVECNEKEAIVHNTKCSLQTS